MSNTSLAGVRIVLDLELFFEDIRRKCYHYVDFSKNKIVGDLRAAIKSNFGVNKDFSLEVNGCYVPENEDIRVLCNEDVVRVIDASGSNCVLPDHNNKCDGQRNIPQDGEILSNSLNDKNIKKLDTSEENENNANITDFSSTFVIQSSSTPMSFEYKRTNRSPLPCHTESEIKEPEIDVSKYPRLNNVPRVKDIIAFKIFKMDCNYCPGVSHYICGKVLKVSEKKRRKLITLRILNGHQELKEPKDEFSLEEENAADCFEETKENIIVDLRDLLDVKLIFP